MTRKTEISKFKLSNKSSGLSGHIVKFSLFSHGGLPVRKLAGKHTVSMADGKMGKMMDSNQVAEYEFVLLDGSPIRKAYFYEDDTTNGFEMRFADYKFNVTDKAEMSLYQGDSVQALYNHNPDTPVHGRFRNFRFKDGKLLANLALLMTDRNGNDIQENVLLASMIEAEDMGLSVSIGGEFSVEDESNIVNMKANNSEMNPDEIIVNKYMLAECSIVSVPAVAGARSMNLAEDVPTADEASVDVNAETTDETDGTVEADDMPMDDINTVN